MPSARLRARGCPIDLIVRGFCCLRPGVPGHTENIRIISIIGRFLEHARIFHFANGAEDPLDGEFFIGSADWMHRNLSDRVEAIAPVEPRALKERLWEILERQSPRSTSSLGHAAGRNLHPAQARSGCDRGGAKWFTGDAHGPDPEPLAVRSCLNLTAAGASVKKAGEAQGQGSGQGPRLSFRPHR